MQFQPGLLQTANMEMDNILIVSCLCCRLAGLKHDKGDRAWYMPGVQITQIVPWHLRLRNLVFPRLVSEAQVYPGAPVCA